MKNNSEILTAIASNKIFFPKYIFTNVMYKVNSDELELCDVLIEFKDFYVCIEVKEKSEEGESWDYSWFKNKVLSRAKNQLKRAVKTIALGGYDYYTEIDGTNTVIEIDKDKSVIPIIVFCNSEFQTYDRYYYSKSLNKVINIFSYADFCTMLDTIVIPYDIIGYMLERSSYMPTYGGKRFIFEDLTSETTLLSVPQTEQDYAEMYLVKNYYRHQDIQYEYVMFYNEFLSMVYKEYVGIHPELFEMLLSADSELANRIIKFYVAALEQLKSEIWTLPLFVHNNNDSGIMFVRKPFASTSDEFNNFINNFGTYYAYKFHLGKVYLISFEVATEDTFALNAGLCNYNLPPFDPELEIKKKELEDYITQYKNSRE